MESRNMRTIRSATLIGYPAAASSVGLDPEKMMIRAGLDPAFLHDHDTEISLDAYLQLLADSAKTAGCADFGIRASIERGMPNLGAVSLLMREAETVEEALAFYTSHLALHSDGTIIHLDGRFQNPFIVVEISARTREESFQATQFCIVGIIMQIRWLIGEDFQPELVAFAFNKPNQTRAFQKFFKCPIQYQQVLSGLVISRDILKRPLVTSSPYLRKLALRQLEPILNRSPNSFATKVDRLIRTMLDNGHCDSEAVAEHFKIDRRTLNRRLARDGETFSSVLQRVRVEISCRALDGSDCSLALIADEAGFEGLSSFSRWFQKSFGCTASAWRSKQATRNTGGRMMRPTITTPGVLGYSGQS